MYVEASGLWCYKKFAICWLIKERGELASPREFYYYITSLDTEYY